MTKWRTMNYRSLLLLAVSTLLLTATTIAAVYFPITVALPLCVILPAIVIVTESKIGGFEKIKIFTLMLGRIVVILAALTVIPGWIVGSIMLWLFRINIAEATLHDARQGHYLNGLNGIILIATTWLFTIQWSGVYYFTVPDSVIIWAVAYTVWNWNFVHLNFNKSISLYHIGVLAAPLLAVLATNPGMWLIMRGTSLTLAGTKQIASEEQVTKAFKNTWFEQNTKQINRPPSQVIINLIVTGLVAAFMLSL